MPTRSETRDLVVEVGTEVDASAVEPARDGDAIAREERGVAQVSKRNHVSY